MTLKDENTMVSFVTSKETKQELKRLVIEDRCNGRKMTLSKKIDEILRQHIVSQSFFEKVNKEG